MPLLYFFSFLCWHHWNNFGLAYDFYVERNGWIKNVFIWEITTLLNIVLDTMKNTKNSTTQYIEMCRYERIGNIISKS